MSGETGVRGCQMDEVCKWSDEFRRTSQDENEIVAFDVLSGDFNMDNASPGKLCYFSIFF